MKQNMGSTDSYVRVMIGIAFYANIFALQPNLGAVSTIILFALGSLCMATAWTKYCWGYKLIGACTCAGESCECSDKCCAAE